LEWSTASPPPAWNYAVLPQVAGKDAYWHAKQRAPTHDHAAPAIAYEAIEMPKNSATGFVTAFFAVVTGFSLIWHIWWLAALGAVGAFVTLLVFAFRDEDEIEIPAERIREFDRAHPAEMVI
jgi:cytochrome o ubiquinol oxidase subunit 1